MRSDGNRWVASTSSLESLVQSDSGRWVALLSSLGFLVRSDGDRWVALLSSLHCKVRQVRLARNALSTAWSCSQTLTDGWQMVLVSCGISDLLAQEQLTTGEVWASQKPYTLDLVWYACPQELHCVYTVIQS